MDDHLLCIIMYNKFTIYKIEERKTLRIREIRSRERKYNERVKERGIFSKCSKFADKWVPPVIIPSNTPIFHLSALA